MPVCGSMRFRMYTIVALVYRLDGYRPGLDFVHDGFCIRSSRTGHLCCHQTWILYSSEVRVVSCDSMATREVDMATREFKLMMCMVLYFLAIMFFVLTHVL